MKIIRVRGLILIGIVVICAMLVCFWKYGHSQNKNLNELPTAIAQQVSVPEQKLIQTNQTSRPRSFTKRLADMTADERAELAKKFANKFKPAVDKWFKAYAGHLPFSPEDFSLDKFHSRFGDYMYTFMITPDITFTIQDSKNPTGTAKVSYLMSRKAGIAMISTPQNGTVPDLTVPVTRDEVINMIKADTGVQFESNEVTIKPTGVACALMGGAFAYAIPSGADPNNGLSRKVDMVFGSDGKLVYYARDPFF